MRSARSSFVQVMLPSGLPGRDAKGNSKSDPSRNDWTHSTTSTAASDNGTRCSAPPFILFIEPIAGLHRSGPGLPPGEAAGPRRRAEAPRLAPVCSDDRLVPKDGAAARVTMVVALVSVFTTKPRCLR